jgi:exonuclease VII small subunit
MNARRIPMKTYKTITLEQAGELSLNSLVQNYNDAIETIWHLQNKLREQMQENEQLWKAYEEISDELYG